MPTGNLPRFMETGYQNDVQRFRRACSCFFHLMAVWAYSIGLGMYCFLLLKTNGDGGPGGELPTAAGGGNVRLYCGDQHQTSDEVTTSTASKIIKPGEMSSGNLNTIFLVVRMMLWLVMLAQCGGTAVVWYRESSITAISVTLVSLFGVFGLITEVSYVVMEVATGVCLANEFRLYMKVHFVLGVLLCLCQPVLWRCAACCVGCVGNRRQQPHPRPPVHPVVAANGDDPSSTRGDDYIKAPLWPLPRQAPGAAELGGDPSRDGPAASNDIDTPTGPNHCGQKARGSSNKERIKHGAATLDEMGKPHMYRQQHSVAKKSRDRTRLLRAGRIITYGALGDVHSDDAQALQGSLRPASRINATCTSTPKSDDFLQGLDQGEGRCQGEGEGRRGEGRCQGEGQMRRGEGRCQGEGQMRRGEGRCQGEGQRRRGLQSELADRVTEYLRETDKPDGHVSGRESNDGEENAARVSPLDHGKGINEGLVLVNGEQQTACRDEEDNAPPTHLGILAREFLRQEQRRKAENGSSEDGSDHNSGGNDVSKAINNNDVNRLCHIRSGICGFRRTD